MWRWKQGRCNTRATSTVTVHRSVFTSSTSFLPPLHTHARTCTHMHAHACSDSGRHSRQRVQRAVALQCVQNCFGCLCADVVVAEAAHTNSKKRSRDSKDQWVGDSLCERGRESVCPQQQPVAVRCGSMQKKEKRRVKNTEGDKHLRKDHSKRPPLIVCHLCTHAHIASAHTERGVHEYRTHCSSCSELFLFSAAAIAAAPSAAMLL